MVTLEKKNQLPDITQKTKKAMPKIQICSY